MQSGFWWSLEFSSLSDKGINYTRKYTELYSIHLRFGASKQSLSFVPVQFSFSRLHVLEVPANPEQYWGPPPKKCQTFLQKLRQQLHQDPMWLLKMGLAYIRWILSHSSCDIEPAMKTEIQVHRDMKEIPLMVLNDKSFPTPFRDHQISVMEIK